MLESSPAGLSENQVKARLEKYGENVLPRGKSVSRLTRFFKTLADIFSLLLLFASLLAFLGQSVELGVAILIIIFINSGFTLYQEWQAEQQMQALQSWIPEQAKVLRDSQLRKVDVKEIVPGDIIEIEEGDRVPADARLIDAYNLFAIEIPLTGEFEPQLKQVNGLARYEDGTLSKDSSELVHSKESQALTSKNVVFMSTSIARGQGKAMVISTGLNTRFGQIAHLTQDIKPPQSPLQKEISYFAKYSFELAFFVGGFFFVIGYFFLHLDILNSLTFIVGVMIACVPEGLQATISSALAINVSKMAKKNVLVKRLSAVQALGSITLICTDKTGTLTRGEMTVNKIWASQKVIDVSGVGYHPKGEFKEAGKKIHHGQITEIGHLLEISAMCNNAKLQAPDEKNKNWSIMGDPTDGAMLVAALKYGINVAQLLKTHPIIHVFPFDSDRKMMTTLHDDGSLIKAYSKGAPASIVKRCKEIVINDKILPITDWYKKTIHQMVDHFASDGMRVIAVAYKDILYDRSKNIQDNERDAIETGMTLIGLVAIKDPPRIEVRDAIKQARNAGIKIAMITGDNATTAKSIAWEVGIIDIDQWNDVTPITGDMMSKMEDIQIAEAFQKSGAIFARITPDEKLRLVNVARQAGEIVAVTGDGANDAPALRQSDIGIAMGVTGTDIAKETADIILTDDSFVSIVTGIESGRSIWINLRNFIYFAFTHNWAELIPFVLFIVINTPIPLLAIHILVIDLCIDIVPSLALSRDPPNEGIMAEPPRSIKEHLFKPSVFARSLIIGFIVGAIGFWLCINAWLAGGWQWGQPLDPASPVYFKGVTMTYASIVMGQVANLLTCRKTKRAFFRKEPKQNPWILYGVMWQFGVLILTIYIPFLQPIFDTIALTGMDWLVLFTIPALIFMIQESWRILANKLRISRNNRYF